jgi:hypothetical protein
MLLSAHVGSPASSIRRTCCISAVSIACESGQPLPGAGMRAVPEAEMAGDVTADVEHIGVSPFLLIAVRRRVQHQHPRPGRDIDIRDFSRLQQLSAERPQRRLMPQHLIDRIGQQGRLRAQRIPLVRMGSEQCQHWRSR